MEFQAVACIYARYCQQYFSRGGLISCDVRFLKKIFSCNTRFEIGSFFALLPTTFHSV